MSVKQQLVTAEAFFEIPHPLDKLIDLLAAFVEQHDCGIAIAGVGRVLRRDPDTVRHVGISFIERERVPAGKPRDWFQDGPSTLAVEAVSFYGTANDLHQRVRDNFRAGARLVWVLWPDTRSVSIHRPDGTSSRKLGADEILDGGDIVPGFRVKAGDLFEIR